jgi:histone deacetylase 6
LHGQQAADAAEQRYLLALQQLHRLLGEKEAAAAAAEAALAPAKARLAAAEARVQAQRVALRAFVSDVAAASARAAAAGRVKAGVAPAALQHFQSAEPAAVARVAALHNAHARLTHQLAALQKRYKQADLLSAEGLHLVDYEQLRIENAGLAARREARAAEVEKLRGKLAQAVQVGLGGVWAEAVGG